jgi:DNA-binding MarR family transcriptional regulator
MENVIKNFIEIPIEIALSKNFSTSEKLLYGFLFSNSINKIFIGSNKHLSECLCLSESNISKNLNKLENKNVIEILYYYENGYTIRNIYVKSL